MIQVDNENAREEINVAVCRLLADAHVNRTEIGFETNTPYQGLLTGLPEHAAIHAIMGRLGMPDEFDMEEKRFWLYAAELLGPDFIDKFRKIAAFMEKVESFR